ncbi:SOS response-associated peptidase family protein [Marinicella sp. W31]|uniref:SOS response-associated peptidase family protein n=1 Tax=Marinicella sp. W31 TaxID=3023713 RepID=UPI0037576449
MCGAFDVQFEKFTASLVNALDVEQLKKEGWNNCFSNIQAVINDGHKNRLIDASWSLDQVKDDNGNWKPMSSKFDKRINKVRNHSTFNCRWYADHGRFNFNFRDDFKHRRCIIPATAFVEGMNKVYHRLQPVGQAIAFAGFYRAWPTDEGAVYSCSLLTTTPHPKLDKIHKKAMPVMLPIDDDTMKMWLDPSFNDTGAFTDLFDPVLRTDFEVTKLSKWRSFEPSDAPYIIEAD